MISTLIKHKNGNWWLYKRQFDEYTFRASCVHNKIVLRECIHWYDYCNFSQVELVGLIYFNPAYTVKDVNEDEVYKLINEETNEKSVNN